MAINKFDKFVTSDYVSQYVPYPMQEMMGLVSKMQEKSDKTEADINALEVGMKNLDVLEKDIDKKNEIINQYKEQLNQQLDKTGGNYINPENLKFLSKWKTEFALDPNLQGMTKSLKNYTEWKKNLDDLRKQGKLTESNYYKQLNALNQWQGTVGTDGKLNILKLDDVAAYADYNKYISDELAKIKESGEIVKKPDGGYYFIKKGAEGVTEQKLEDVLMPMLQGSMGTPEYEQMLRDMEYKKYKNLGNMETVTSGFLQDINSQINQINSVLKDNVNPQTKKPLTDQEKSSLTSTLNELNTKLGTYSQVPKEDLYNAVMDQNFMNDIVDRFTNQYSRMKTVTEYSYNPVLQKNQELDIKKKQLDLAREKFEASKPKGGGGGGSTTTPELIEDPKTLQRLYENLPTKDVKTVQDLVTRFNTNANVPGYALVQLKNAIVTSFPQVKQMSEDQFTKWAKDQLSAQGITPKNGDLSKLTPDQILKIDPSKLTYNGQILNIAPSAVDGFKQSLIKSYHDQQIIGQQYSMASQMLSDRITAFTKDPLLASFVTLNAGGSYGLLSDDGIAQTLSTKYKEGDTVDFGNGLTWTYSQENLPSIISKIKDNYKTKVEGNELVKEQLDETVMPEINSTIAALNGPRDIKLPFIMVASVDKKSADFLTGVETIINKEIANGSLKPKNLVNDSELEAPESKDPGSLRGWKLNGYSAIPDPQTNKNLFSVTYYDKKNNKPILDDDGKPITGYVEASEGLKNLFLQNPSYDPQGWVQSIQSSIFNAMSISGNEQIPDSKQRYADKEMKVPVNVMGTTLGWVNMNSDGTWLYEDRSMNATISMQDVLDNKDVILETLNRKQIPYSIEDADDGLGLLSLSIYLSKIASEGQKNEFLKSLK